jgi:secondary thiamine-phosphate synthase enzyme
MIRQVSFLLPSFSRGFHLITHIVEKQLDTLPQQGFVHLFIRHTSAGLTINENADTSVRTDFETIFNRLVPENSVNYTHSMEGPDDMPAHIKSSLVGHSVTIPITGGKLGLGTWQGIFLCEFRNRGGRREIIASIFH